MPATLPPRRLILLTGTRAEVRVAAGALIAKNELSASELAWPDRPDQSPALLGQDRALAVMDAYQGLNPDHFGRICGTIRAGGALLILCPELEDWPNQSDPEKRKLAPYPLPPDAAGSNYLRRWIRLLQTMRGIEIYPVAVHESIPAIRAIKPHSRASTACTDDQDLAVAAVLKTALGKRKRPALLSADRGRGKSAALGLAAGQLLLKGQAARIVVTAAGFAQAGNVFKHAHAVLGETAHFANETILQHTNGTLQYLSIERLLAEKIDCDLILIDEAAALGVSQLTQLASHYPRLAFATTEQGYEGSGRGFTIKFREQLKQLSRGQHPVTMETPVRWAAGDPLERWMNQLLLLKLATPATVDCTTREPASLTFRQVKQRELLNNESLLLSVFGLLVEAHYQTRPVDARFLLDAPNSLLYVAEQNSQLIGLVWLMREGELELDMARELVAGRRRPQGHLVPQTLAAHLGIEQAARLNCGRVQRIAVLPEKQGLGIGSWMLGQLEEQLCSEIDYLASSFGADLRLTRFWHRTAYTTVRISDRLRASSGLHSAVVVKPLSQPGERMLDEAVQAFGQQYPAQLNSSLKQLAPDLALALAPRQSICPLLDPLALKTAVLFAWAKRPYTSSLAPLRSITLSIMGDDTLDLPGESRQLLIARILQGRNWAECEQLFGLKGQAACISQIRMAVRTILEQKASRQEIQALRQIYGCEQVD